MTVGCKIVAVLDAVVEAAASDMFLGDSYNRTAKTVNIVHTSKAIAAVPCCWREVGCCRLA